jgi:hypothetical protein
MDEAGMEEDADDQLEEKRLQSEAERVAAETEHALYLEERTQLVDAARESARTFDKAVLTFGSAVFGFSIAFLKDVAPVPAPDTLNWLRASWWLFSIGLLVILLSFLFSHQACLSAINLAEPKHRSRTKRNYWSLLTSFCNVSVRATAFS